MVNQYWSWVLSILGGLQIYLAGKKLWYAWLVTLLCEAIWLTYTFITKQWGFLVGCAIDGIIGTKNLIQWKKEHDNGKASR